MSENEIAEQPETEEVRELNPDRPNRGPKTPIVVMKWNHRGKSPKAPVVKFGGRISATGTTPPNAP